MEEHGKSLARAYKRKMSYHKALRKRRIARTCPAANSSIGDYYPNLHQYSKNKVHCSCYMCSAKTRNKGKRRRLHGNYAPSINYKHSDQKKVIAMNMQEKDYSLSSERE